MHFSSTISIAIVAALPVILGSPVLDTRQNGVTCQTSDGSLTTEDVTMVINNLRLLDGSCRIKNGHASDCTTVVHASTATISVCGGEEEESCSDVADYATQIQQTCLSGDLVGGTYQINAGTRVGVINSNST